MEDESSIKEISNEDVQIMEDEVKEDIPVPFDEVKEVESMKAVHPKVGMKFEDQDEMYELWREYGQNMGFPVRRRSSKKDDNGKVRYIALGCGLGDKVVLNKCSQLLKRRPQCGTNCKVRLIARLDLEEKWEITLVYLDHNHSLIPSKQRFYRCNRKLTAHVKRRILMNDTGEVKPNKCWIAAAKQKRVDELCNIFTKVAVLGANDEERYKRYKEWAENELRQANVKKPGGGNDQIPKSMEEQKAHKTIDCAEQNASANVQDLTRKSQECRPRVHSFKKRDDRDKQTHQSSEEERENIIEDPSQMETQAKKKPKQNKKHGSKETMQESITSIPSSSRASVNNFGPSWRGYPQMQFFPNNQSVNAQNQFWGAYRFGVNGIHVYGMPPPYMQHAYGMPRPYLQHAIRTQPPLQKHMQPSQDVICSEDDVSS